MTAPALTVNGPNMNNAYQHYLKVGMYRHQEIHTDNEIFIDDLNVSKVALTHSRNALLHNAKPCADF